VGGLVWTLVLWSCERQLSTLLLLPAAAWTPRGYQERQIRKAEEGYKKRQASTLKGLSFFTITQSNKLNHQQPLHTNTNLHQPPTLHLNQHGWLRSVL
jgi:hypothetical protein